MRKQIKNEVSVVVRSNTIIYPYAMMIKFIYAKITNITMLASSRFD